MKFYTNELVGYDTLTQGDTITQISPLFFPHSGYQDYTTGAIYSRTLGGRYWLNYIVSHIAARTLTFNYSVRLAPQAGYERGNGYPLRCLARLAKRELLTLPALLLILYVPKVGDYRGMKGVGRIMI